MPWQPEEANLDLARAIPPPPRARHCTCPPARPSAILEEPPAMGNRGSRRSGNGAGCCPRPTCSDRQSLRIRGSRRSGNGAGCCTRSTYSDRQSLRNRGSRRSSGNGACGCTALVLRVSSLPRTRQPLTRRRCSCEGAQCSCKCNWADARDSRPTQRRAAMGAAGGTAPVHGITNHIPCSGALPARCPAAVRCLFLAPQERRGSARSGACGGHQRMNRASRFFCSDKATSQTRRAQELRRSSS